MTFHQQTFTTRYGTMGDIAEQMFDKVHPKSHRLGLNRPPFFMGGMTAVLRHTPDRMLRDRLVECMGIGKDRLLKMKVDKLFALHAWTYIAPVWLFVYDQPTDSYYEAPLAEWKASLDTYGTPGTFDVDGKQYIALAVERFPVAAQPIPQEVVSEP